MLKHSCVFQIYNKYLMYLLENRRFSWQKVSGFLVRSFIPRSGLGFLCVEYEKQDILRWSYRFLGTHCNREREAKLFIPYRELPPEFQCFLQYQNRYAVLFCNFVFKPGQKEYLLQISHLFFIWIREYLNQAMK